MVFAIGVAVWGIRLFQTPYIAPGRQQDVFTPRKPIAASAILSTQNVSRDELEDVLKTKFRVKYKIFVDLNTSIAESPVVKVMNATNNREDVHFNLIMVTGVPRLKDALDYFEQSYKVRVEESTLKKTNLFKAHDSWQFEQFDSLSQKTFTGLIILNSSINVVYVFNWSAATNWIQQNTEVIQTSFAAINLF